MIISIKSKHWHKQMKIPFQCYMATRFLLSWTLVCTVWKMSINVVESEHRLISMLLKVRICWAAGIWLSAKIRSCKSVNMDQIMQWERKYYGKQKNNANKMEMWRRYCFGGGKKHPKGGSRPRQKSAKIENRPFFGCFKEKGEFRFFLKTAILPRHPIQ